jgi:urate oxidase
MPAMLRHNSYGKSKVRLTKLIRQPGAHELFELSVDVHLQGDFTGSYTAGDNSKIVATDSMKNTVYVLAKEHSFEAIEEFASIIARHFVNAYPQVTVANIRIEQTGWTRIQVDGQPHPHAFVSGGPERRTCQANLERGSSALALSGGITGLMVLKTAGSEFSGFVNDRYTTLKDTHDRIFATSVDAEWLYSGKADGFNPAWNSIRTALLKTFATHHSLAVQQTLLAMGEAALNASNAVTSIRLSMPNNHRIPFELKPFGLDNANDIFVPIDEPHGLITGVVERR